MILKDRPPSLRRWLPVAYDLLAHAGLTDIDAEFEQFTVDAWCTPKRIGAAHLPNQLADFFRHRWAPGSAMTDFPGPEQPEALAVSANDGFRFDDHQGRPPIGPKFAQPNPEEPIGGRQFGPLYGATQHAKLVPEREVLQLECGSGLERRRNGGNRHVKRAERQMESMFSFSSTFAIGTHEMCAHPGAQNGPSSRRRNVDEPDGAVGRDVA